MDQSSEGRETTDRSDELVNTPLLLKERDLRPRICMLPADGDEFEYAFREIVMDGHSSTESEKELSDLNSVVSCVGNDKENPDLRDCEYCRGYYCVHCISRQMPGQPMLDPGDFPFNIRHWIWAESGSNDYEPWRLLCELDDGHFAFYKASCCYTGCACASIQDRAFRLEPEDRLPGQNPYHTNHPTQCQKYFCDRKRTTALTSLATWSSISMDLYTCVALGPQRRNNLNQTSYCVCSLAHASKL